MPQTVTVRCQVLGQDRGYTDLELTDANAFGVIFEAKIGWQVPTLGQLERYVPRLKALEARHKLLVSVSAASQQWAKRHLPEAITDVPVTHLSWTDIQRAARRAFGQSRSPIERLWLEQLINHLDGYGMNSNIYDARAFVVSLSRARIKPDDPLTWIDVINQQRRYFHPVGTNGWPVIPPAYVGFRYHAAFRSVHFVEAVKIVDNLASEDPRWPETDIPNFVYTLGPAMVPPAPLPLGNIHPSMRNRVSLDLLLSGVAATYGDAIGMMLSREKEKALAI